MTECLALAMNLEETGDSSWRLPPLEELLSKTENIGLY